MALISLGGCRGLFSPRLKSLGGMITKQRWPQAIELVELKGCRPAASTSARGSTSSISSALPSERAGSVSSSVSSSSGAEEERSLPPKPKPVAQFCRQCGGKVEVIVPEGDRFWRHICTKCGYNDWQNPRMVVGCIVEHDGKLLLCRRGIEPQKGLWTVPAGFLEMTESTAEGASRETWEEAGAKVAILGPYCHFDIPVIGQAYLLFRARLAPPYTFAAQLPESLDAQLFAPEDIPFEQLAFSSVAIALRHYLADLEGGFFHFHHGVIVKSPGAGPNEPGSFSLIEHFAIPTSVPTK